MDSTKEVLKMRRWVSAAAYERSIAARAGMTGKKKIVHDKLKASMRTANKLSSYVILFFVILCYCFGVFEYVFSLVGLLIQIFVSFCPFFSVVFLNEL